MKEYKMAIRNRVAFVDLAKGFCILLVVWSHSAVDYGNRFDIAMTSFRMPLYFVLSGLFFKEYSGFVEFIVRKTNKLLIPFAFFYILIALVLSYIFFGGGGTNYQWWVAIWYEKFNGMPQGVWFLLCLFFVNILAYVMLLIAKKTNYEPLVFSVLCMSLGLLGYLLGYKNINLPLYIDSAFAALPFFVFGRMLRKYTHFLESDSKRSLNLILAMSSFALTYLVATGKVNYRENQYNIPFVSVYLCGIMGTMGVLFLSKWLGKIPIVSYMGRYSIMILCSHQLVIMPLQYLCESNNIHGFEEAIIVFFITSFVCFLLIEPMLRFMPYVTAQKDIIKY